MADQPETADDQATSEPGGDPVPEPALVGEPLPPGHQIMTARDAFPFVRKQVG